MLKLETCGTAILDEYHGNENYHTNLISFCFNEPKVIIKKDKKTKQPKELRIPVKYSSYRDIDIQRFIDNEIRSPPRVFDNQEKNGLLFIASIRIIQNDTCEVYDTDHQPIFYFNYNDLLELISNSTPFPFYKLVNIAENQSNSINKCSP